MSNELAVVTNSKYDYSRFDEKNKEAFRKYVAHIKADMGTSVERTIRIGSSLAECKEALGHGNFGPWLQAEFGMTERTASNFMAVARRFSPDQLVGSSLESTVLVMLAAKSTPDSARKAVLDKASDGTVVTIYEVKEIIAEHKGRVSQRMPRAAKAKVSAAYPPQKPFRKRAYDDAATLEANNILSPMFKLVEHLGPRVDNGDMLTISGSWDPAKIESFRTRGPEVIRLVQATLAIISDFATEVARA